MALITKTCSARGATCIFTINDITLRAVSVSWIAVSNALRILIFDNLGAIVLDINTGLAVSPVAIDLPVSTIEVVKADTTIKSYLSPRFAVYFGV